MVKSDAELIEEARIALLQLYSSKSTLQATVLLSLAVAFFAFIQTIPMFGQLNQWFLSLFYAFVLTAFVFFTIRAFGRLIYWGNMAGFVDRVSAISEDELKKELKEHESPTYFLRLNHPCHLLLRKKVKVHGVLRKLTNTYRGIALCCSISFLSFFTYFAYFAYFLISDVIGIIMVCILAFLAFALLLFLKK
jgi:hypothetical protein